MRLIIDEAIHADHATLAALVAAGLAGVDDHDIEVAITPSDTDVVRWLLACRPAHGCGQHTNVTGPGWRGHAASTRAGAQRLAGDPDQHHPPHTQTMRATYAWSGRSYPRRPAPGGGRPRWLLSLRMPADPRPAATGDAYPRVSRYTRYATAPPVVISGWAEELVHLVAHEARHVDQRRHRRPRSEIDAERWAHDVLGAYRTEHGLPILAVEAVQT
ncbi:MAG: hypothetical protein WD250_17030 [Egibacteraceae bacterium]